MARYPKAFEQWYKDQCAYRGAEFDNIILRMRDEYKITIAEGERRFRKMLYMSWKIGGEVRGKGESQYEMEPIFSNDWLKNG